MTLRVLFVSGEYPPMQGGIGDYTARLVEALADIDIDSRVLTSTAAIGSDLRVLARVPRWDWSLTRQTRQAIEESNAGLVHIQYQTGAFGMHPAVNMLPFLLRRRDEQLPVITTFHDLLPPYLFPKAGRLRGWATSGLAQWSSAVVVTNEYDHQMLSQMTEVAARVVRISIGSNLPEPIDSDRQETRERLSITADEYAVGFFGFLTEEKGVDLLIEALGGIELPVRLVIIGGSLPETDHANRSYYEQMRVQLAQSPVPVTLTGHLSPEEALAALSSVDLLVLPFRSGANLRRGTLIAAARSGTPLLTSSPGPNDSLAPFEHNESVWLVPPGDVAALRQGIQTLRADRALAQRMASTAVRLSTAFDWSEIARRHADLYARALAGDGASHGAD